MQDVRLGLVAALKLVATLLSLLVAVAGVAALWTAMAVPPLVLARRRVLRKVLLVGLAAGVADAVYWLWIIGGQRDIRETSYGIAGWSLGLLILVGPIIVAVRLAVHLIYIGRSIPRAG